jgi:hypothetical protein
MDTAQNGTANDVFNWTDNSRLAAQLLAEDELTDAEIADRAGHSRRQLARWKNHPEFAAHVALLVKDFGDAIATKAIAKRVRRVDALNSRWLKMHQLIAERAKSMASVPGGETGLLVRKVKMLGSGENGREIDEYEVDCGLLKEMRELEKQAAIEVGHWSEKHEYSGAVEIIQTISGVDHDAVLGNHKSNGQAANQLRV